MAGYVASLPDVNTIMSNSDCRTEAHQSTANVLPRKQNAYNEVDSPVEAHEPNTTPHLI